MIEEIKKLRKRGLSFRSHFGEKKKPAAREHLAAWPLTGNTLFISWKLLDIKLEVISSYFEKPFNSFTKVLRIYDITNIHFNGSNAHFVQEIPLKEGQQDLQWIGLQLNHCYITELGVKLSERAFFPLLRSNAVQIPSLNGDPSGKLQSNNTYSMTKKNNTVPRWIDHVSTYSYYESMLKRNDE